MQTQASQLYRFTFILVITLAVWAAFLFVIRAFLLDILLAAIFAGMVQPSVERSLPVFGGRRGPAAAVTVVIVFLSVLLPVSAIIALVGSEALSLSQVTFAWVKTTAANPAPMLAQLPPWLTNASWLKPAISYVTGHIADIIRAVSGLLSHSVSSVTHGTITFLLDVFVISFALLYFLRDGPSLIEGLIERIPVERSEARAIVERTVLVTSAALKGIIIVGTAQGILIGSAFAATGLGHPWFWGTVAAFASTVPGLGSSIIWIPGSIYLLATGHIIPGVALLVWGALVVAIADNLLRLYVVGRTAAIPSFLIFISTLGGLTVIGPAGVLIGPLLVGLLLGVLDLYQTVLKSSGLSKEPEPSS